MAEECHVNFAQDLKEAGSYRFSLNNRYQSVNDLSVSDFYSIKYIIFYTSFRHFSLYLSNVTLHKNVHHVVKIECQ